MAIDEKRLDESLRNQLASATEVDDIAQLEREAKADVAANVAAVNAAQTARKDPMEAADISDLDARTRFAGPVEQMTRRELRQRYRQQRPEFRQTMKGVTGATEQELKDAAEGMGDIKREIGERRDIQRKARQVSRGRGSFSDAINNAVAKAMPAEEEEAAVEEKAAPAPKPASGSKTPRDEIKPPPVRTTDDFMNPPVRTAAEQESLRQQEEGLKALGMLEDDEAEVDADLDMDDPVVTPEPESMPDLNRSAREYMKSTNVRKPEGMSDAQYARLVQEASEEVPQELFGTPGKRQRQFDALLAGKLSTASDMDSPTGEMDSRIDAQAGALMRDMINKGAPPGPMFKNLINEDGTVNDAVATQLINAGSPGIDSGVIERIRAMPPEAAKRLAQRLRSE